jgi:hypothetical protein
MYRLREHLGSRKIRFFACGEYGEQTLRPHYHYLIFNYNFPDKIKYKTTKQNNTLYTSPSLQKLWPYGHSTIGDLNYQTAAYTARYVMKKITGDQAASHYNRFHPISGKMVNVSPEFSAQSRRPGIGDSWFKKFRDDAFPSDFLIVDGKKHPVPKFYTKKLSEEEHTKVLRRRKASSLPRKADNTPERLRVREAVKQDRLNTLKRDL